MKSGRTWSIRLGIALALALVLSVPALAGLPGHTVVRVNRSATVAAGGFYHITVTCPAGKKVLGGGFGNNAITWAKVIPTTSMPSPNTSTFNSSSTQWTVSWLNIGTTPVNLNFAAYAICATP